MQRLHQHQGNQAAIRSFLVIVSVLASCLAFQQVVAGKEAVPGSESLAQDTETGAGSGTPADTMTATPSAASPAAKTPDDDGSTPPLPTQDPALANTYTPVEGIQDAVARSYASLSNDGIWFQAVTADFDTGEQAYAAVPIFVDRADERYLGDPAYPTTMERVELSVPAGFDRVIASFYTSDAGDDMVQYISSITVSRGDRLYSLDRASYEPGFDSSVVDVLSQYVLDPLPRDAGSDEITSGLWSELPILAELPDGYVLTGNYIPRSFGPIPPV